MKKFGLHDQPWGGMAVHCDDPEMFDTYDWFGKERGHFRILKKSKVDERNLLFCRRLDISNSEVVSLNANNLNWLVELLAEKAKLEAISTLGLQALAKLDLCQCPIKLLDTRNFVSLTCLDVRLTKLTQLDARSLRQLQKLQISDTKIAYLDTSILSELTILEAENTKLSVLNAKPLTKLRVLNISKTKIVNFDAKSLIKLTKFAMSRRQTLVSCSKKLYYEERRDFQGQRNIRPLREGRVRRRREQ